MTITQTVTYYFAIYQRDLGHVDPKQIRAQIKSDLGLTDEELNQAVTTLHHHKLWRPDDQENKRQHPDR